MGDKRATVIVVLFGLCLLVSTLGVAFASSDDWVEVIRFTGTSGSEINTESFTCDHLEWRIRWSYSPDFGMHGTPGPSLFAVNVFQSESKNLVSSIGRVSTVSENGTLSLSEQGTFYLHIQGLLIGEYSIIIEQNIESIPEFPSWIILPFFLAVTFSVILLKKKIDNRVTNKK